MVSLIRNRIVLAGIQAVLSLALFSSVSAQPVRSLTLQEAIRMSLENSKTLKITSAQVKQAEAALEEARMHRLPDLKFSGSYLRVNQPKVDLKIPLKSDNADNSGESGGMQDIKVDQAVYGMATATLPLFSGFRLQHAIASARYLKKAAELDAEHSKAEMIRNTVEAYYNLYKAHAAVDLVNENLKLARQRVADFANLEANGLMARNDLLKARLHESNVELTLTEAVNNKNIANFNMDIMLGFSEGTELQLDTTGLEQLPRVEAKSLQDWEAGAFARRNDYKAIQQREMAGESGVKVARGEYYPSLALTGGYMAADIPGLLTVTNAVNVGVGLSYNLASLYKNGSKVKQALAQQEQLHQGTLIMNDRIRTEVFHAYQNYLQQLKKIEVYTRAVEQARENYRITKNKYDNALATTTDLLDADVANLQAAINLTYSKADVWVAYNTLMETVGELNTEISSGGR